MFDWRAIGAGLDAPKVSLQYRRLEVARLWQRIDSAQWHVTLRMHLDSAYRMDRPCQSFKTGQAGALEWGRRHSAQIALEEDRRHQAWSARQTWRG